MSIMKRPNMPKNIPVFTVRKHMVDSSIAKLNRRQDIVPTFEWFGVDFESIFCLAVKLTFVILFNQNPL